MRCRCPARGGAGHGVDPSNGCSSNGVDDLYKWADLLVKIEIFGVYDQICSKNFKSI